MNETPNHALQRTRRVRRGCNRCVPWAGSLSLGSFSMRSLFLIPVVLLALAQTGCMSRGPWRFESADGPLNGPGSQSGIFVRTLTPPPLVVAVEQQQRGWSRVRDGMLTEDTIAKTLDSYCAKLPEFDQWIRLQAYMDDVQLRFAPAKFWIVSIDPIVVVLTPFAISNPDSHSLRDLGGAADERRALVSSIFANRYNFGTNIEASSSLQWFVVGSDHRLSSERFDSSELRLTADRAVLVLTKGSDGKIHVARINR